MPYMTNIQSVTDGISLSVSKSKLVYSSFICVDNKLTIICLLTQQQSATVFVRNKHVILLIQQVLHLWGQKSKANGAYDKISHFACNFAKCSPIWKKFFHQHNEWQICNEVTYHNFNA